MAKQKAPTKEPPAHRDVAVNRRALHDYEILERIEAGIALTGSEIKSIRQGKVSLQEAYARPEHGQLWLQGAHIADYEAASYNGHEPRRARRLLLHRSQINELARQVEQRGLTLIPLRMYLNKRGLAKVEIAVARGRRQYDKRQAIAQRDAEREMERALRQRTR
ncbi:MAG TPA: SsrA-binding protein SmpB [Dehalococcoidia bacterium]|jgi:SsrA-binding protein